MCPALGAGTPTDAKSPCIVWARLISWVPALYRRGRLPASDCRLMAADLPPHPLIGRFWTKANKVGFWAAMVCPLLTRSRLLLAAAKKAPTIKDRGQGEVRQHKACLQHSHGCRAHPSTACRQWTLLEGRSPRSVRQPLSSLFNFVALLTGSDQFLNLGIEHRHLDIQSALRRFYFGQDPPCHIC